MRAESLDDVIHQLTIRPTAQCVPFAGNKSNGLRLGVLDVSTYSIKIHHVDCTTVYVRSLQTGVLIFQTWNNISTRFRFTALPLYILRPR